MEVRFYKNKTTNEISLSLTEISDDNLLLLTPNTTDGAVEKHVPEVTINGKDVHVEIGSVIHPMTEAHHIVMIALVTDRKAEMKKLNPTGEPKADFALEDGEKIIAVYEFCNLHGLWMRKF